MADPAKLNALVEKMIAAGATDDEIRSAIADLNAHGPLEGAKRELSGQIGGLKELGGAAMDVAKNLIPGNGSWALQPNGERKGFGATRDATLAGLKTGELEGVKSLAHPSTAAGALDPTGFSSLLNNPDEGWDTKAGRGAVLGAELLLPFKGKAIAKGMGGAMLRGTGVAAEDAAKAAKAAEEAAQIAEATQKGKLRGIAKAAENAANPKVAAAVAPKPPATSPEQLGVNAATQKDAALRETARLRGMRTNPAAEVMTPAAAEQTPIAVPSRGPGLFSLPRQGTTTAARDFSLRLPVTPGENLGTQALERVAEEQAAQGVTNNFEKGKRVTIQPEGRPTSGGGSVPAAAVEEPIRHVTSMETAPAEKDTGVMTWAERRAMDAGEPGRAAQDAANAAGKAALEAEAAKAGLVEAPGRPPAYGGPERRQSPRKGSPTLDSAFSRLRDLEGVQTAQAEAEATRKAEAEAAKKAAEPPPLAEAMKAAAEPAGAPAPAPPNPANRGGRLISGSSPASLAERWMTAWQAGERNLPPLPDAVQDVLLKRPDLPQPLRLALQGRAADASIPQLEGVSRRTIPLPRDPMLAVAKAHPGLLADLSVTMQGGQAMVSGKAGPLKALLVQLTADHGPGVLEAAENATFDKPGVSRPVTDLTQSAAPAKAMAGPAAPSVSSAPVAPVSKTPVAALAPEQVKAELAGVNAALDRVSARLMEAGRGGERLIDTAAKSDPIGREVKGLLQRQLELRQRAKTVAAVTPGPSPAMRVPVTRGAPMPQTVAEAQKDLARAEKAMRDSAQTLQASRATKGRAALVDAYDRARAGWANAKARLQQITTASAAFSKDKTIQSLNKMVQTHGEVKAAKRAGMSVEEVRAVLATGSTEPKVLAKYLRGKEGADRLAKILDISPDEARKLAGGGKSRLPDRAADGIYAAAEREIKADGKMSPKTKALIMRLTEERGAVDPKLLTILGLGGTGALIGASADKDHPGRGALTGGLAGLGLGAAVANPRTAFNLFKDFRREMFLTGGAIPKNIATAAGAPLNALWEGMGTKPLKEMVNIPENARSFINAVKAPPHASTKWGQNQVLSGRALPSHVIAAIDETATKALQRAGLSQDQIDHLLLTSKRKLFGPGWDLSPAAKSVADVVVPFQRVPVNVMAEGLEQVGKAFAHPTVKGAVDLAGTGLAGKALSDWAGDDPRKRYLATILLAGLGPRTAVATVSAMTGKAGRQVFGGISPIPEQALTAKDFIGWPAPGAKTPFTKMVERLRGQK